MHDHSVHHHHGSSQGARNNLRLAFFLNFIFTIIEFTGGLFTGSMAILSDALHDFGDSVTIGLSWYFEKVAQKKRDQNYSYGYRRFSLVSALISSIVLFTGSVFIITKAVPAIMDPQPVHKTGMLGLAILGMLVNGIAVFKLKSGQTANEKVVRLHLLEDVLGWAAVLIGSLIILFFDLFVVDPLLSLLISIYILYRVFKNLKEIVLLFLQGIPPDINIEQVVAKLSEIKDIHAVHDVHVWSLDGNYHVLSAHLVVSDGLNNDSIGKLKDKVRSALRTLDIKHETLEIETISEHCDYKTC